MAGKVCDEGEWFLANAALVSAAESANLYLGLYTDVAEPGETANLSTISELAEGANGYDRIALAAGDWVITDDESEQLQKTFTANGGDWGNVTGYFITDVANGTAGNLIAVENFDDGPYNVLDGLSVLITAKIVTA